MTAKFVGVLAQKLQDEPVLFYVGAGLSRNWFFPSGFELVSPLIQRFRQEFPTVATDAPDIDAELKLYPSNLPKATEAMAVNKGWFIRNVLLKADLIKYPYFFAAADQIAAGDPLRRFALGTPHVVIGRLAKEELLQEVMTTNYDCLLEAGCHAVGMVDYPRVAPRSQQALKIYPWPESYRVVAKPDDLVQLASTRKLFQVFKIHGCITDLMRQNQAATARCAVCTRCRPDLPSPQTCPFQQHRLNFVLTYRELLDWRQDQWARDLFWERVRSRHFVFVGADGSDMVTHAAFRNIFEEACARPSAPKPRAQGTEVDPSFPLRQILRTANDGALDQRKQVWELKRANVTPPDKPKDRIDELFRRLYNTTMRRTMQRSLRLYGKHWVVQQLEAEQAYLRRLGGAPAMTLGSMATSADGALQRLMRQAGLLQDLHWQDLIPAAVRLSWLLSWHNLIPDVDLLRRINRPHYYVPLTQNKELTFTLLTFYAAVAEDLGPANCNYLSGGWVVLPPQPSPSGYIRPVVMPVADGPNHTLSHFSNLPRSSFLPILRLLRTPGIVPRLALLHEPGKDVTAAVIRANNGVASALRLPALKVVPLSVTELFPSSTPPAWSARFY